MIRHEANSHDFPVTTYSRGIPVRPDLAPIASILATALRTGGYDPTDQHFEGTARRWFEVITREFAKPLEEPDLEVSFEDEYKGLALMQGVEYSSLCAHHLLPFTGRAAIAYLPSGRILGISKLARLIEYHTHRITVQEAATREILVHLNRLLDPKGAIVVLEGQHTCMMSRGVRQEQTTFTTADMSGLFLENAHGCRDEFYRLVSTRAGH